MISAEFIQALAQAAATSIKTPLSEQAVAAIKAQWPARFYASYDHSKEQPTRVTGWYDVWSMSNVTAVPEAKDMIAMSQKAWDERKHNGMGVLDGKLVDHVEVYTPTLQEKAEIILPNALTHVMHNYTVLNERTPDIWVAYIKALRAIANGDDTTSTDLPVPPKDA